jgi:hypothetical protein
MVGVFLLPSASVMQASPHLPAGGYIPRADCDPGQRYFLGSDIHCTCGWPQERLLLCCRHILATLYAIASFISSAICLLSPAQVDGFWTIAYAEGVATEALRKGPVDPTIFVNRSNPLATTTDRDVQFGYASRVQPEQAAGLQLSSASAFPVDHLPRNDDGDAIALPGTNPSLRVLTRGAGRSQRPAQTVSVGMTIPPDMAQ